MHSLWRAWYGVTGEAAQEAAPVQGSHTSLPVFHRGLHRSRCPWQCWRWQAGEILSTDCGAPQCGAGLQWWELKWTRGKSLRLQGQRSLSKSELTAETPAMAAAGGQSPAKLGHRILGFIGSSHRSPACFSLWSSDIFLLPLRCVLEVWITDCTHSQLEKAGCLIWIGWISALVF